MVTWVVKVLLVNHWIEGGLGASEGGDVQRGYWPGPGSQEALSLLFPLPEYDSMTWGHLLLLLDSTFFIYMFNLCDFYVQVHVWYSVILNMQFIYYVSVLDFKHSNTLKSWVFDQKYMKIL